METVNIHAAKTHFSKLVDRAQAGEEIIIANAGKPVARLVPLDTAPKPKRVFGQLAHLGPIPAWFDDPLPDDVLAGFEGIGLDGPV
jgi:prevent-host-death family protein